MKHAVWRLLQNILRIFLFFIVYNDAPFILYSNRVSIRKVNVKGKGGRVRYSEIISGLRNAIGVDFDWQEQRIYWTDVLTDKIQRAKFDGTEIETVITGGLISAEGTITEYLTEVRLYCVFFKLYSS
jgi:integrin beta 2